MGILMFFGFFYFFFHYCDQWSLLFFFFLMGIIYLFIYGCVVSLFLCEGFLQLWQVGATLHRGARASHYRGPSCCGALAPDAQAQQLWLTGLVAPRHVGSSQTRARTRIPYIGRQTLNHCATREAPILMFLILYNHNGIRSHGQGHFMPILWSPVGRKKHKLYFCYLFPRFDQFFQMHKKKIL